MFPSRTRSSRGVFPLLLLLVCCLALNGCFMKKVLSPVETPPPRPVTTPPQPSGLSVTDAEAAYNAGQSARAEQIAMRLFARQDLSAYDTARVSRILALSASANSHPYLALNGLERWLVSDPSADSSDEWRTAYLNTLGQLPPHDAAARARSLTADASRPFPLRAGAALFLASRQWETPSRAPQALAALQAFYLQTGDGSQRGHMEHALFAFLASTSDDTLTMLDALVDEANSKAYPHAIIRLESLRRMAMHAQARPEAEAAAAALADGTTLADPSILKGWDMSLAPPAMTVPLAGRTVVLALPLSGPLGSIGKKIVQGADEALSEFAAAGHSVNLVKVDTENPAWLNTIASLPPQATVVGGPLRMDRFAAARQAGITDSRVFFSFLPGLGDAGEEGRIAWRFFASPEDQFTALFAATSRVGVTDYAILMPDNDPYAARMADMFTAHVRRMGGRVVKRTEYPHAEQEKWNKFIGSFLGAQKKATHAPAVSHQAIFLPDAWRNMELIVPNLFYFMETRQMLLGTSLWEQGLSAADHVTAHYYNLAVFPGAWDKTGVLSQAGAHLQAAYARAGRDEPDFWGGLGYDFVRFASTLDIQPGWSAPSVNAMLASGSKIAWSIAPLRWSADGRASQDLFLFTPVAGGFAPADLTAIEAGFTKAWRH